MYSTMVNEYLQDDLAVLVVDRVTLREGDGEEFSVIREIDSATGRRVNWNAERGDWLQIELPTGVVGWVRRDTAVTI